MEAPQQPAKEEPFQVAFRERGTLNHGKGHFPETGHNDSRQECMLGENEDAIFTRTVAANSRDIFQFLPPYGVHLMLLVGKANL